MACGFSLVVSYVTATIVLEHVDEQSCFSCHSWTNQQNSRELLVHFSIYCSFKRFLHTVSFPYLYFTTYSSLYSHSSQAAMCQFHILSVSRFTLLPLTTNSFSNSIHFLLSFSNHHWANHSEKTMNSRETGFFLIEYNLPLIFNQSFFFSRYSHFDDYFQFILLTKYESFYRSFLHYCDSSLSRLSLSYDMLFFYILFLLWLTSFLSLTSFVNVITYIWLFRMQ